jgi:hypothetical protein
MTIPMPKSTIFITTEGHFRQAPPQGFFDSDASACKGCCFERPVEEQPASCPKFTQSPLGCCITNQCIYEEVPQPEKEPTND